MTRIVFILIGCLLAVTASAKLWMLLTDPFADLKSGMPLVVIWLGVALEVFVLGLLISPRPTPVLKFAACTVLFGLFFLLNLAMAFAGGSSCSCFGDWMKFPLWSMVVFDFFIFAICFVSGKILSDDFLVEAGYELSSMIYPKTFSQATSFRVAGVFSGIAVFGAVSMIGPNSHGTAIRAEEVVLPELQTGVPFPFRIVLKN